MNLIMELAGKNLALTEELNKALRTVKEQEAQLSQRERLEEFALKYNARRFRDYDYDIRKLKTCLVERNSTIAMLKSELEKIRRARDEQEDQLSHYNSLKEFARAYNIQF